MIADMSDIPVVIMCGGRGSRLRPATDLIPKALVPVNGQPIIDYVVNFFASIGIRDCHLCVGYRGDQIRSHFEKQQLNMNIRFSNSGDEAGILERIFALRENLSDRFIVAYCDTFIDIDVTQLHDFHVHAGVPITLVTAPIQSPFGLVEHDGNGQVISFDEKPVRDYFIGYFVMESRLLRELSEDLVSQPDGSGIVALFQQLVDKGKIAAFRHEGLNITFNTDSERAQAEQKLEAFFTLRETDNGHGE